MKTQVVNEPDIWDAMLKIREQLMALDRKMDLVLARVSTQSNAQQRPQAPVAKPTFVPPVKPANQGRPVFRATCADCQKECELPFKPSGDRPVYCKECFAKRRAGNNFKTAFANRPQAQTPAAPPVAAVVPAVVSVPEAPAKKKKKPVAATKSPAKKSPAKKKPVAKKKRK